MQHRSTRNLQPSVRAPDTRTAPTSAYLSNYRYRAHRTYPGDPAGRQSGASITDYIPERWRKIGIGNEVKVVRGPPGAQTVAPRACESTRADLSRRILRTCDPSYQTCAPCYHRYVHREHRNAPSSRTTALCACTRHSNCTYECISKQLSLPRLPSASRRPPSASHQPPGVHLYMHGHHIRCRPHQRKLRHTFSTYVRMRIERAYRWPCAMTPSAF